MGAAAVSLVAPSPVVPSSVVPSPLATPSPLMARPPMRRPRPSLRPQVPTSAALPHRSRDALLTAAHRGLDDATAAVTPGERYSLAHLAALRAAAAVLAARARPGAGHRGRPASAWRLLVAVAPELAEWAAFFAAGAGKRSAAEAGLPSVTTREADDLIRDVDAFLRIVETMLGVTPPLPSPDVEPSPGAQDRDDR